MFDCEFVVSSCGIFDVVVFLCWFLFFEVLYIVGVGDIGDGVVGLWVCSGGFLKNGVCLVFFFYLWCGVVVGGECKWSW